VPSGSRREKNLGISSDSKRAEKNSFDCLLDENGSERTSQPELEDILVTFYKDLFAKDSLDMQIQTELIDDSEFSLTDLEREKCEGLFTKDELYSALKGLHTGKSPGSDGLPTESFLAFWDELGDFPRSSFERAISPRCPH